MKYLAFALFLLLGCTESPVEPQNQAHLIFQSSRTYTLYAPVKCGPFDFTPYDSVLIVLEVQTSAPTAQFGARYEADFLGFDLNDTLPHVFSGGLSKDRIAGRDSARFEVVGHTSITVLSIAVYGFAH